jgi:hypothetical protein
MIEFLGILLGFLFVDCLINGVGGTLRWAFSGQEQKKSWSAYREGTDVNGPVFFGVLMLVIVLILAF